MQSTDCQNIVPCKNFGSSVIPDLRSRGQTLHVWKFKNKNRKLSLWLGGLFNHLGIEDGLFKRVGYIRLSRSKRLSITLMNSSSSKVSSQFLWVVCHHVMTGLPSYSCQFPRQLRRFRFLSNLQGRCQRATHPRRCHPIQIRKLVPLPMWKIVESFYKFALCRTKHTCLSSLSPTLPPTSRFCTHSHPHPRSPVSYITNDVRDLASSRKYNVQATPAHKCPAATCAHS